MDGVPSIEVAEKLAERGFSSPRRLLRDDNRRAIGPNSARNWSARLCLLYHTGRSRSVASRSARVVIRRCSHGLVKRGRTQHSLRPCTTPKIAASSPSRGLWLISPSPKLGTLFLYGMPIAARPLHGQQMLHPDISSASPGSVISPLLIAFIAGRLSVRRSPRQIFGPLHWSRFISRRSAADDRRPCAGRTRTITIEALLMAAGHFLMAFDVSFSSRCSVCYRRWLFQGNLASLVGALYATGDNRRADGFRFTTSLLMAAYPSPLIAAHSAKLRLHYGFGAAGVGHVDRPERFICPVGNGCRLIRPL